MTILRNMRRRFPSQKERAASAIRGAAARYGALGLILGVLAACGQPPEFVTPLSEPGTVAYDKRIVGRWYMPMLEPIYVQIKPAWDGRSWDHKLRINMLAHEGSAVPGSFSFEAHASTLYGNLYYNVRRVQTALSLDYTEAGEKPGYIIVRVFHMAPDLLLVCGLMALPEGDRPKPWRTWISETLEGTGLTPRFAAVEPILNGRPIRRDRARVMLHTLVEGEREDLIHFVIAKPEQNFRGMMVLARVGTLAPAVENKDLLKDMVKGYADRCDVNRR